MACPLSSYCIENGVSHPGRSSQCAPLLMVARILVEVAPEIPVPRSLLWLAWRTYEIHIALFPSCQPEWGKMTAFTTRNASTSASASPASSSPYRREISDDQSIRPPNRPITSIARHTWLKSDPQQPRISGCFLLMCRCGFTSAQA